MAGVAGWGCWLVKGDPAEPRNWVWMWSGFGEGTKS